MDDLQSFTEPENWPPSSPDLNPAACLPTAGSRHWAPEGRSGNKLGTNQPGLYWSSNWTVSETISLNHCSEWRPFVWLLSACYISFAKAYVCDVYDITNENEMFYFIMPHPVYMDSDIHYLTEIFIKNLQNRREYRINLFSPKTRFHAEHFFAADSMDLLLLPSPSFSERRRYCVARHPTVTLSSCHAVFVSAALFSAAKVMHCIQCSFSLL